MTALSFADLKLGRCMLPLTRNGIQQGILRAVEAGDAATLSAWRYANRRWFLTEFPADTHATRTWIEAIRQTPDRLLLVIEVEGKPVGHVGLRGIKPDKNEAEIDNVLRGRATPRIPGLMSLAVRTLVMWARDELGLQRLHLHVLHDNPARSFYSRLGFVVVGAPMGLSFEGTSGHGTWKPGAHDPQRYLLRMELVIETALRTLHAKDRKR